MVNVVVVGAQWGDEGKGKIVDWLSDRADVIIRFQGGHNAGHTLVIDGTKYRLNLLPSGILRKGKIAVIGNGTVVEPWELKNEIQNLQKRGIHIDQHNLKIAENAVLVLPLHRELDEHREKIAKQSRIGTTVKGIGPAYEDKVGRRAIRIMDLKDKEELEDNIEILLQHHNPIRKALGMPKIKPEILCQQLSEIAEFIIPYIDSIWQKNCQWIKEKKTLLFEGAQGIMLDIDHGTYPFVTSSNTIASQASIGASISPEHIKYALGIVKAYTTRVGEGPFPTEQDNYTGTLLREKGCEYGTVTGRKRRCGWLDAVITKQALKIAGINGIVLTKMDVLDEFHEIEVCVAYHLQGKIIHYLPAARKAQKDVKPIYHKIPGWKQNTRGTKKFEDLPQKAKEYVNYIEKVLETPVSLISTSPEREDTIVIRDPYSDLNHKD